MAQQLKMDGTGQSAKILEHANTVTTYVADHHFVGSRGLVPHAASPYHVRRYAVK